MNFNQIIRYCPRCGSDNFLEKSPHFFHCAHCDFHYYINCTPAVIGIVSDTAGRVLLIRRSRDPGKGKLSIPGGFVDAGETIEEALARELGEEVKLDLVSSQYLGSHPNPYLYKGVIFPVVDLVFVCEVRTLNTLSTSDEVSEFIFLSPDEIDPNEIAFPSIRYAIDQFRKKQGN